MLRRVIFDRDVRGEESPFGLSVNKMRASGPFLERVERLYKIESDAALKPGTHRLGCLVR
jgi:hypothetical protein